jgi:Zn-finger nucleic acid-binding protein
MLCPNENIQMVPVKIEAHYGQIILLDQCPQCGGLWFDKLELYRAKLDQAEKIEKLDAALLNNTTVMQNSKLICPQDRMELIRFNDSYFPQGIIVAKCPVCDGFWLNRGEFTKYQKARLAAKQPREVIISESNAKLNEDMQRILAQYQTGNSTDSLTRLSKFLSTPMDTVTLRPDGSVTESAGAASAAERTISTATSILMLVLRLFLRV